MGLEEDLCESLLLEEEEKEKEERQE